MSKMTKIPLKTSKMIKIPLDSWNILNNQNISKSCKWPKYPQILKVIIILIPIKSLKWHTIKISKITKIPTKIQNDQITPRISQMIKISMEPPYILAILDVLDYFALFGVSESILVVLVGYSDHFVTEGVYFGQLHFMYKKKRIFFFF